MRFLINDRTGFLCKTVFEIGTDKFPEKHDLFSCVKIYYFSGEWNLVRELTREILLCFLSFLFKLLNKLLKMN